MTFFARFLKPCLSGLLGVLLPFSAAAQQLPTIAPFEIEYDIGNNLISAGVANLSLTRSDDEWVYSLTTKPSGIFKLTGKGKIQEISIMNISEQLNFQTQRYTYRQDEEDHRSVDAWFNWDDNEITYRKEGEDTIEKINDPIMDRLSVTLAVMDLLKEGFQRAELRVFDSGRIKTVVFDNEGTFDKKTPLGNFETIRIRNYNRDGVRKRETITYFAPSLNYIPVIIEHTKNGSLVARMTIKRMTGQDTAAQ